MRYYDTFPSIKIDHAAAKERLTLPSHTSNSYRRAPHAFGRAAGGAAFSRPTPEFLNPPNVVTSL
jgi:hypothetical protein